MPKRTDVKKVLVIGSGPIVIGQAAEFDYAGTQACLSLKEEGYEVILVNSNPATIMTDKNMADKIYIEPLAQLVVFAKSKLPPADARLMRRLVRDNQFRKMSPLDTFRIWPKVLAGEKKWIFPFSSNADAVFDSGLEYELSVLKRYVAGLLEKVKIKMPTEAKAEVLSLLLTAIHDADPTKVPGDSILRETIGGSLLEY